MAKQLFACLLLVLAFCVARTLQQNVTCASTGSDICRCTAASGGITLDISNYLTYPVMNIPDGAIPAKYSYTFAPCDGIPAIQCGGRDIDPNVKNPTSVMNTFGVHGCKDSSKAHRFVQVGRDKVLPPSTTFPGLLVNGMLVCEVFLDGSNLFTVIATDVNSTWIITDTSANSLVFAIHFTAGEGGKSATVTFIYESSTNTTTISFQGDDTGTYTFLVKGNNVKAVGGGGSKKGGGTAAGVVGLVLISLFIVGVATYFIVGSLVNYYYKGARGAEIIPNYTFWKDGFFFMISPCYKRGERKGYLSLSGP